MIRALLFTLALWFLPTTIVAQNAPVPTKREMCQAISGDRFAKLDGAATQIVSSNFRDAKDGKVASCLIEGYVNPAVNFAIMMQPITGTVVTSCAVAVAVAAVS